MRYDNPDVMAQLAAEYVIGTLRGRARRRYERLMQTNAEARAQTEFWEQRLGEFGQALQPVAPPAAARSLLLEAAGAETPKAPQPLRRTRLRRRSRWMWPYAAGFATAASLVLAFLFGQRNALDADTPPQWLPNGPGIAMPEPVESQLSPVMLGPSEAEAEISTYLAKLSMPASSMGWLISISSDHRRLYAVAAEDFLQVGRFRVQLWGLLPNAEPIHLGALPISREAVASFAIPDRLLGHDEVRFAVTLEPGSGELAPQPRGPIMSAATALDSI